MTITLLVGQNIRNCRKRKGIKLDTLAGKLHIDKSTLSKMETGHISITVERIGKIAEALEVDFNELLTISLPEADRMNGQTGGVTTMEVS